MAEEKKITPSDCGRVAALVSEWEENHGTNNETVPEKTGMLSQVLASSGRIYQTTNLRSFRKMDIELSGQSMSYRSLKQFSPTYVDGVVKIPKEIVETGISQWSDYLVGYFVEKRLPLSMVKDILQRNWTTKGDYDIGVDNDLFYFKFSQEEDKQMALEIGSMFLAGRLFVIKPWGVKLDNMKNLLRTYPIWVKLIDVPKRLWSDEGLSYISSILGKPLCLDESTANKDQLSYARVCVEVNVGFEYPSTLTVDLGEGEIASLAVEYAWKPNSCSRCNSFRCACNSTKNSSQAYWPSNIPSDKKGKIVESANSFEEEIQEEDAEIVEQPVEIVHDSQFLTTSSLESKRILLPPEQVLNVKNQTSVSRMRDLTIDGNGGSEGGWITLVKPNTTDKPKGNNRELPAFELKPPFNVFNQAAAAKSKEKKKTSITMCMSWKSCAKYVD